MTRKSALPIRIFSSILSLAVVHASSATAFAGGAKALSARAAAGPAAFGVAPVGLGAAALFGGGVGVAAPALTGSLPTLSLPRLQVPASAVRAVRASDAAGPVQAPVPIALPAGSPRATAGVSKQLSRKAVSIQPELKAASDLGSVSVETARGTGVTLAAKVFGFSLNRGRSSAGAVNPADDAAMAGKLKFSSDWIDPSEAYAPVSRIAKTAMRTPSVTYADVDLETVDGGLRVRAVRYGLVDTMSELAGRFSFVYKVDAKAPEGRFDQLRPIYSFKGTGAMALRSLDPKISFKNALIRLHRARPDFSPVRAALYWPTSIARAGKGLVYRFTDNHGAVLEIDAVTGRYDGDPVLFNDVLGDQLRTASIPAPTSEGRAYEVSNPAAPNPWPVRLGGIALAGAYAGASFLISYALGWPVVGAAFGVFFTTGFIGFATYISAIETSTSRYGTEHFITNPARARVGEAMLNAGILFGLAALAAALTIPSATAIGLLGATGTVRAEAMVQPASLYARAYEEAQKKANGPVHFGDATTASPVREGNHWKFNFYSIPEAGDAKAMMISVDFQRGGSFASTGGFYSEVSVYEDVSLPADQPVFPISPDVFKNAVQVSPEEALALAKREAPAMGGAISVSLRAEIEGENKERGDFRYRFFDDRGHEVTVNARSGETRVWNEPRMESREERLERFKTWKSMRDLDAWLGETLPLYSVLKWAAIIGGLLFLLDMFFNFPALIGAA